MGNSQHTAKVVNVVDHEASPEKTWKGLKPVCLSEFELIFPRLSVQLCGIAAAANESDRSTLISEALAILKWKIVIEKIIKEPDNKIIFRKKNKPCAIVGHATHLDMQGSIPFVVFRGQEANNRTVSSYKKYKQEPFVTSKNFRVGRANVLSIKDYQKLVSLGLVSWLMDFINNAATPITKILITGHANGGCMATLMATELVVDNSKVHDYYDVSEKNPVTGSPSGKVPVPGSPSVKVVDPSSPMASQRVRAVIADNKYYAIPDIELITFGSPKTFDKITAYKLHRLHFHSHITRFVFAGDMIPTLPTLKYGAIHIGDPVFQREANQGWYKYHDKPTLDFDKLLPGDPVELDIANNALQMYKDAIFSYSPLDDEEGDDDGDGGEYEEIEDNYEEDGNGYGPHKDGVSDDVSVLTGSKEGSPAAMKYKTPSPQSKGKKKRGNKKSPGSNNNNGNLPDDIFD